MFAPLVFDDRTRSTNAVKTPTPTPVAASRLAWEGIRPPRRRRIAHSSRANSRARRSPVTPAINPTSGLCGSGRTWRYPPSSETSPMSHQAISADARSGSAKREPSSRKERSGDCRSTSRECQTAVSEPRDRTIRNVALGRQDPRTDHLRHILITAGETTIDHRQAISSAPLRHSSPCARSRRGRYRLRSRRELAWVRLEAS